MRVARILVSEVSCCNYREKNNYDIFLFYISYTEKKILTAIVILRETHGISFNYLYLLTISFNYLFKISLEATINH